MNLKSFICHAVLICSALALSTISSLAGPAPSNITVVPIGAASHEGNGIAVDASGNIYLTGQHFPSRYDSDTATRYAELGGVEYVHHGQTDYFLMKLDSNLNILWTRVGGSSKYDYGTAVRVSTNGDVFVTGAYQDDFEIGGMTVTNNGNWSRSDSFVARYDASGTLQWLETATGNEDVTADDVELGLDGSVYIAGRMSGYATFDDTQIGQNYQSKVFLAKYSATGQFEWARGIANSSQIGAASLTVDSLGNVLVGGTLNDGDRGVFLAGYDPLGNEKWFKQFVTGDAEELSDVEVDADGNIWFSGRYSGSTFDLGNGAVLTNSGTFYSGYVAMADTNRQAQWVVPVGSRGYEFERDSAGDLIVAGYHQAPYLDFAGDPLPDGAGNTDAFVGSLSASGSFGWIQPWASDLGERSRAVALAEDGSIVVTGEGNSKVFGTAFRGSVFVAKLSSPQFLATGPALDISFDGSGLKVSWPEASGSFQLEAAETPGGDYQPIAATPVAGQNNAFWIPTTHDALFVRLKETAVE